MIQARKLGHIVLKVRDAAASRDFYTRALGLKVAHEDLEGGAVFLSFGIQHHDLALFQLATGAPPDASAPGLHHTAWQVGSFAELQAAHRDLRALGIAVESTIEHNVSRSVYFRDPDGNRVEIYCDMVEDGFEAMRTLGPKRDVIDRAVAPGGVRAGRRVVRRPLLRRPAPRRPHRRRRHRRARPRLRRRPPRRRAPARPHE
jgi:catechol 2,3-dioxygenase